MGRTSVKYIFLIILVDFSQISSPNNLERKLDLPRRCRRRINRASSADRGSASVKYNIKVRWGAEIRAIENVEKLCPKLHVESF
jgi:hypothetical protein